jgi:hypothetical protein
MSLGSIAHLQYYFARTGLLDGKGGQLAKKKPTGTLDLSSLDTNFLSPGIPSDRDSSYSSMGSSPELLAQGMSGLIVESPISQDQEDEYYYSSGNESHPEMLPPTVSTYNYNPKPIPPPPSLSELKSDLKSALKEASNALSEIIATSSPSSSPNSSPDKASRRRSESDATNLSPSSTSISSPSPNHGWHEIQGMHILDIITLAIRAAKMYYTAHDQPARLSAIKSERKIRSELLGVMDVLKRMATRNFASGMRTEEKEVMESWVAGVWDMLGREEEMERQEAEEMRGWSWLDDSLWTGTIALPNVAREISFLKSMDNNTPEPLPEYTSSNFTTDPLQISPFLTCLQSGLRLVTLHNAIVKKSNRPFGAIPVFHTDTAKPYRCAENLRFWIKAAELRWEVILKVDVMGVVNGIDGAAWQGFEDAMWVWAAKVREELMGDLKTLPA